MLDLFKLMFIYGFTYLFFYIVRDKYFKYIITMVLAITLFGSGISWSIQTTHFIQKKTESISKSVYGVQQSIDKLGNSVNQVNETKDKVENGVGKVTKPIEDADKAVKKKIYKYTSPIFGEPSKELKD